jgi:ferredoxin, 2Fe-2S
VLTPVADGGSETVDARVMVTDRAGNLHAVRFSEGRSLMETIRDSGIDDIAALCGGTCSCATCHVFIADGWTGRVGPPVQDELDLLETSEFFSGESRLSCQVVLTAEIDGLPVIIAPED